MGYFEVTAQNGLKIRQLPSLNSGVLEAMPGGMVVRRMDETLWNGDWYRIRADFSKRYSVEGYSHRSFLAAVPGLTPPEEAPVALPPALPEPPQDMFKVVPSSLNLREQASTRSNILMSMPTGTIVTKISASGEEGWWHVSANAGSLTQEGYAHSDYLRPYKPKPAKQFDLLSLADISDVMTNVRRFVGDYANGLTEDLLLELNKVMTMFEINSNSKRFSHFMSQLAHESANFTRLEENLNYSAGRLWEIFQSKFDDPDHAAEYANQPERIANRVYANRIGNGDESSGDGWRYRGRGFIQLTGRENYREIGKRINVDLENQPDLAKDDPKIALQIAAVYWDSRNINEVADQDDVFAVTKRINGGYNGIEHRENLLNFAKSIWGV